MASVKNYMEVIRVNVFAKMVGLVDEHACYSMEDMKKYLEILDFC